MRVLDRLAAKGKHVMLVTCPDMGCRAPVVAHLNATHARCSKCGKEWKLNETHLIRGERDK